MQVVRVAEPAQCLRIAAVAQIVSVIALSHRAPGSDPIATPLVAAGLTQAPLDRRVLAEAPAWAALGSAVVVVGAAVVAEEDAAAGEDAEGKQKCPSRKKR